MNYAAAGGLDADTLVRAFATAVAAARRHGHGNVVNAAPDGAAVLPPAAPGAAVGAQDSLTVDIVRKAFIAHYGDPNRNEEEKARKLLQRTKDWYWKPDRERFAVYVHRVRTLFVRAKHVSEPDQMGFFRAGLAAHAWLATEVAQAKDGVATLEALVERATEKLDAYRDGQTEGGSKMQTVLRGPKPARFPNAAAVRPQEAKRKGGKTGASPAKRQRTSPAGTKKERAPLDLACSEFGLCRWCHGVWGDGSAHKTKDLGNGRMGCANVHFSKSCACAACSKVAGR